MAFSLLLVVSAFGETMRANIKTGTAAYVSPQILMEVVKAAAEGNFAPALQATAVSASINIPYNTEVEIIDREEVIVELRVKGKVGSYYTLIGWLR